MAVVSGSRLWSLLVAAAFLICVVACGPAPSNGGNATELRLGYYANLTHAAALVGVKDGIFATSLGPQTELKTNVFNAGPDAVEALLSNSIDATYVGPNPAINAFIQSHGKAIRIISGATSGGAALVVSPDIKSVADLKGKTIASPQLGNTQDIALRWWLKSNNYQTTTTGGGDVKIMPQDNATTLQAFKAKQIDGAWVPEPWATRLVLEGGGHVLVDERSLWPGGQFVTTMLVVRTDYLNSYPTTVKHLLEGQMKATDFLLQNPTQAQNDVNDAIAQITSKRLAAGVVSAAWQNLTFTNDPIAGSLRSSADHAFQLGLLKDKNLAGIYQIDPLNGVLLAAGKPTVTVA
ncbi:MAG: sulfonate transport system substrate-binding protein [Chloroflexota bacterium]|nr:sulfonate transport system substrate-binding protein [Chloroflexota bacterium]